MLGGILVAVFGMMIAVNTPPLPDPQAHLHEGLRQQLVAAPLRRAHGQAVRKATPDDVPRARRRARARVRRRPADAVVPARRRVARARAPARLFDVMLRRLHLERDECYTTEDVVGGALWVPPGNWRLGDRAAARAAARRCCACSGAGSRAPSAGWP